MQTELRCVTWKFVKSERSDQRKYIIIIIIKYQKQATTVALNGEDALMLLATALIKLWIHFNYQSEYFIDRKF